MRIFAVFILGVVTCAQANAPLDRLFFSQAERRAMDVARERSTRGGESEYISSMVDGIVQRSDGKNTIWINGRPYRGGDEETRRAAALPAGDGSAVRVIVDDPRRAAPPKVQNPRPQPR